MSSFATNGCADPRTRNATEDDDGVVVVPPAPGDVEIVVAERAARAFGAGDRSMTLVGGFGLAALRAAAAAEAELDHEPFPLVRRLARASEAQP